MGLSQIKRKVAAKGIIDCIVYSLLSALYFIITPVYKLYLRLFIPINKNQLLFLSTPDYADNAFELYIYIRNHYVGQYSYIWLISKDRLELPDDTRDTHFVRYSSAKHKYPTLKSIKAILTSEYIFYTHSSPMQTIKKRNGQSIINLWHGCGYKANEITTRKSISTNNCFDYALVPSELFIPIKKEFWGCTQEEILPLGYPRYDQFFSQSSAAEHFAADIKRDAKKLVIWMPTFRKTNNNQFPEESISYSFDLPILNSIEDLITLDLYCKKLGIKLCIKRHILQIDYAEKDTSLQNIVFIDNDDIEKADIQLYELLPYTDALISDYSSVAIDYLLLDKPIGFCLDDFEQYKSTRGFVFDDPLAYMPGAHIYTLKDLITFLEDVATDRDLYAIERHDLMPLIHNSCDNYCRRIWETIQNLKKSDSIIDGK